MTASRYPLGVNAPNAHVAYAPQLIFPLHVWQKLNAYVQACEVEINGFGWLERLGRDYLVADVFILDQVATQASVENEPDVLAAFMTDCIRRGVDVGKMRLQWHSHVNMSAYFSETDCQNIERYAGDWMASIVLNKRGAYQARFDAFKPLRMTVPMATYVQVVTDEAISEAVAEEVSVKVKRKAMFRNRPIQVAKPLEPVTVPAFATRIEENRNEPAS